ncbi:hypothetical protein [Bdellovibrio sp. BCCA]|uniref:hypothetical protein n=1 Tax=unclassified Bdellovibrio TaxID=2633795 RepID=UPI0025DBBA9E|nr:hypothetical protein [uncultured Bdellovibrio sp.]
MKKMVKTVIAMSVVTFAFASASVASPKCSHRVASASNDLLKDTNPAKASKTTVKTSDKTQSGVR